MFDCHTHVQFAAFEKDWKEVIDRALAAGISVVNVGTQRDTSQKAVDLARSYPAMRPHSGAGVYAAIGLHPVHTTKSYHDEAELGPASPELAAGNEVVFHPKGFTSRAEEFDYAFYLELARDPQVVAIGECGFDYYRLVDDGLALTAEQIKEKQKNVFIQHVHIAQETGKALMIHCRPSKGTDDAYEDLLVALNAARCTQEKILHFYVGSVAMTKKFLEAPSVISLRGYSEQAGQGGFNFEFGGVITFARDYDEQIRMIPMDRLLTETDAPYVAPAPYRGQRNEPACVVEVVKKLAELKGVSYDEMAKVTDANARRIFGITK